MNRRTFLTTAVALSSIPLFASSRYEDFYLGDRILWLTRNGESIRRTFFTEGRMVRAAYEDLCYFLQDSKANIAVEMDPELLSGVSFLQKFLWLNNIKHPIGINSGYRTERTNALTEGAVRDSYHTKAAALDITVPQVENTMLAAIAERVGFGGIGLYRNFVHLDTGRARKWLG